MVVSDNFHPFPRLPLELREEIWRLCLPHRVYEVDDPIPYVIYDYEGPYPCSLGLTSKSNVRPPLLTRVCRESRRVASITGKWMPNLQWRSDAWSVAEPCEADWKTGKVIDQGLWEDTARDSAHLNWDPNCDVEWGPVNPESHPLTTLAEEAGGLGGTPSFMLEAMRDSWERNTRPSTWNISTSVAVNPLLSRPPPPKATPTITQREQNLAALKLLPEWKVVVKVIVIHLDIGRAADSGLFGISGDEIIQVVDAALPLVSQLYELAEWCERQAPAVTIAQDFTRISYADMDAMVKREAFERLQDYEIGKRLRPAIMFRLCTEMCNHINTPKGKHLEPLDV